MNIQLLDCTLRDGAYITSGNFGDKVISGIIHNLTYANIEYIEVGWLKDEVYKQGSTYFHQPQDMQYFLPKTRGRTRFVAMIDYGRYDVANLTPYTSESIDTIRVVFPKEKYKEAIQSCQILKDKGYNICLQAANTQSYSDMELISLATMANAMMPDCLSIVDTFGVMYEGDLDRIFMILHNNLDKSIRLGFHSHNNLQLSFALSIHFVKLGIHTNRNIVIDSSLCGMGRGAGNTCTELITHFLNTNYEAHYDIDKIMDTIDTYMQGFINAYSWGYSIPYCIAGQLGSHVNNIAYLQNTHKISYKDMRNTLALLPKDERKLYDYDNLEQKYLECIRNDIEDTHTIEKLRSVFSGRDMLLIAPGSTTQTQKLEILQFIQDTKPLVIGINSVLSGFVYDYLFMSNTMRYKYAIDQMPTICEQTPKILTSNVKVQSLENEFVINFNAFIDTRWRYFDNSTIMAMKLFARLGVRSISLAGLDGYSLKSYSDVLMESYRDERDIQIINAEIQDMLSDFQSHYRLTPHFITPSRFNFQSHK